MRVSLWSVTAISITALMTVSCAKKDDAATSSTDNSEVAQSAGDTMSSIDESGGSGGTLGYRVDSREARRLFAKYLPGNDYIAQFGAMFSSRAEAASCLLAGFGSCSSNTIVRTFGDCTLGLLTFTGTVTLAWGGGSTSCALGAATDFLTRSPEFTITGPKGTFTVSKTATIGQKILWSSGSGTTKVFNFSNDGIRRVVKNTAGTTLFDFTTKTTADVVVTGTSRASRTLSGGTLQVTNNTTGKTCDLSPSAVTWDGTCTCATSGTWTGTCDSATSTIKIESCGVATVTVGGAAQSVTLDRCVAI